MAIIWLFLNLKNGVGCFLCIKHQCTKSHCFPASTKQVNIHPFMLHTDADGILSSSGFTESWLLALWCYIGMITEENPYAPMQGQQYVLERNTVIVSTYLPAVKNVLNNLKSKHRMRFLGKITLMVGWFYYWIELFKIQIKFWVYPLQNYISLCGNASKQIIYNNYNLTDSDIDH